MIINLILYFSIDKTLYRTPPSLPDKISFVYWISQQLPDDYNWKVNILYFKWSENHANSFDNREGCSPSSVNTGQIINQFMILDFKNKIVKLSFKTLNHKNYKKKEEAARILEILRNYSSCRIWRTVKENVFWSNL